MDIHGYIHVWISDLGHVVDISMDIMVAHLSQLIAADHDVDKLFGEFTLQLHRVRKNK